MSWSEIDRRTVLYPEVKFAGGCGYSPGELPFRLPQGFYSAEVRVHLVKLAAKNPVGRHSVLCGCNCSTGGQLGLAGQVAVCQRHRSPLVLAQPRTVPGIHCLRHTRPLHGQRRVANFESRLSFSSIKTFEVSIRTSDFMPFRLVLRRPDH